MTTSGRGDGFGRNWRVAGAELALQTIKQTLAVWSKGGDPLTTTLTEWSKGGNLQAPNPHSERRARMPSELARAISRAVTQRSCK